MSRHEEYDELKLKNLIKEIAQLYGGMSVAILKRASTEHPEKYPSYKTFERKLGGIKNIKKNVEGY